MSFEPILLPPEEELEESYPYRRVWRTASLEAILLLLAVVAVLILTSLIGALPEHSHDSRLKVGIAVLPLLAWFAISYRGERNALEPRAGILGVLILGALVANGVAIPLEERLFTPDRWLPSSGFFARVLGYMFTIGFTIEFLKYVILRYTVWPREFRQRLDGIAYALAVSQGFAVMVNLRVALDPDTTLLATTLRVASVTYSHLAIGLIVGVFLAELRLGKQPIFWMPMGLLFAAFLEGLYFAFRSLSIVGGLKIGSTASSPVRGLLLAVGLIALMYLILSFLIESADSRMEALAGRGRMS